MPPVRCLPSGCPLWLVCGGAPEPGICGANLGPAVVSALLFPAGSALIKERVPAGRLRRFNARYEMGRRPDRTPAAAAPYAYL
ncbi:hypothetical protein [Streptomyces sp. NRRL S-1813]|uniref:hypothetical protein n=1 Tax=Streptomyces sp. NRRL S-1813 TaxID=1463888 RepID=UPI0004C52ED6|nr:hypothetical protein [Streptomyces sp. NRRL S-1813]